MENKPKQTAVEWLSEQLWKTPQYETEWQKIIAQAKEMEKRQNMENNKSITAVEWLISQIEEKTKNGTFCTIDYMRKHCFPKAKEMEKQQIKDEKTLDQKLFELANEFAVAGYDVEAGKLHTIHNNFNYAKNTNN